MKQRIKLGDVYMDAVTEELPSRAAEVTDKPVESGVDISDHMKMKPSKVHLTGTMVNDAAAKLNILKNYQRDAKLLRYIGRNIFDNMVIERLDTDHATDAAEGYHFDIVLTQVSIAKPEMFKLNIKPPETTGARVRSLENGVNDGRNQAKFTAKLRSKTNAGRQQVQSKQVSKSTINSINKIKKGVR